MLHPGDRVQDGVTVTDAMYVRLKDNIASPSDEAFGRSRFRGDSVLTLILDNAGRPQCAGPRLVSVAQTGRLDTSGVSVGQPPLNSALYKPLRMYRHARINRHNRPLRSFSNIRTTGSSFRPKCQGEIHQPKLLSGIPGCVGLKAALKP